MRVLTVLWLALFPLVAVAQDREPDDRSADRASSEGFWPSEKMVELFFVRWADEAAVQNELDDDQTARIRERMLERWPKFLKENREKIQPVMVEFIEMRLEMQPPDKERVQAWAKNAGGVLDLFRGQINDGIEDFRKELNPLQRAKFEKNVLEFSAGLQVAESKIKQWERGEFEEREFWDPPRSERRRRRAMEAAEEARRAADEAAAAAKDEISKELDAWDAYVQDVIRMYELDDAQRTSALSLLKEMKERATTYRDRNRERIDRLERRVIELQERNARNEDTKADMETLSEQLVEVYGPIDGFFEELKRRVDAIPTREQTDRHERRVKAEEAAKASPEKTEPGRE
jgi:hypothetical protein